MPETLIEILEQLALKELAVLMPELGELVIAMIAALVARIRGNNPDAPAIIQDAASLAMETVRAMEGVDWGSFFSKDEVNKLKAQAALNDVLGKAADRGIVLAQTDAELLIRGAVEILRTKVSEAVTV